MEILLILLKNPMFVLGFSASILMSYLAWKKGYKLIQISWFLWFVLDISTVTGELFNGKSIVEIGLSIGYALGAFIVFLFSIPFSVSIKERNNNESWYVVYIWEIILILFVLTGIYIYLYETKEYSVVAYSIALFSSAIPTFIRAWEEPWKEPIVPWSMWLIASFIGLFYITRQK